MKKYIALILEMIPIISAPLSYALIVSHIDSAMIKNIIAVLIALSFMGFIFSLIGRKIDKEHRIVRVLGLIDYLATLYVIALFVIAIFAFGQ